MLNAAIGSGRESGAIILDESAGNDPLCSTLPRLAPAFQLLCLAARRPQRRADAQALAAAMAAGPDWSVVIEAARCHRVTPLVLDGLRACGAPGLPASVLDNLRLRVMTGATRSLGQAAEMGRLARAFGAAGVRVLALKGVVLSQQLYGSPAVRPAGDMDLLVDPRQLWEADAVLRGQGYRRDGPEATPRHRAATARWAKDLSYRGAGGHVELHQRLSDNPRLLPCPMDRLWAERETVILGGIPVHTLPRRFLPLYLCTHGAGHFWERLCWLADMAALLARPAAQSAALDDAEAAGLGPLMRQALSLAHDWLAMPISDPRLVAEGPALRQLERFVDRYSACWAGGLGARRGGEWLWRIQMLRRRERYRLKSDWRYRWDEFTGEGVTSSDWEAFPLPDRLFWLYPLLRPVGWLIRRRRALWGKTTE